MKIISLAEIKAQLTSMDIIPMIEQGFVAYSQGKVIAPPMGELIFTDPPGDVHIKYGYLQDDEYYIIKIASGFYQNFKLNLSSSNGIVLVFSQKTGAVCAILLDEGYLTDIRTAAAGAIAAKYLAPKTVNKIGVVGTGTQARLQLQFLKTIVQCREVMVFGRDPTKLLNFQSKMQKHGYNIQCTQYIKDITTNCNFIVTTTPAITPLLFAKAIQKGTHITAVGADSPHKQELDAEIFSIADIVVADSISQCIERGEIAHAIRHGILVLEKIVELGNIISHAAVGRTNADQITIADLTGIVAQDIQIAKAIFCNK